MTVWLSPPTWSHSEERSKWEESLATAQIHSTSGAAKQSPQHATRSRCNGLTLTQNSWPPQINLLLCGITPIASLLQVGHYACLYGNCEIKAHTDSTSNSLSFWRKANFYKNDADKMSFHTCPDLMVLLMHTGSLPSIIHANSIKQPLLCQPLYSLNSCS